uniref:Uncharacterized protein n=1 Tax=Megaselia scalaris TaxID=36166 RepID=T1H3T0_MEGSC
MEQSKIPKPGGNFTKIPLPSTKRSFSVANDSKIARPAKSFFGLKPPSIFQSKKLAAGEKYNSAKSFLHKKFATIDASTPSRLQRNPQQDKFYTPKEMARSDTFIREEDESPFARPQTEKP